MKYLDLYLKENLIRQTSFLPKNSSKKPASFRVKIQLQKAYSPIMQIMGNWMHSWLCFFLNLEAGILSEEAFFILSWYIYERTKLKNAFIMILIKLQAYFIRTYLCKCTTSSSKIISHHWSQSRIFDAYLPSCWRVTATQWK